MADPKYVNLPGIAHDQPDTYETPDLPESDQYIDFHSAGNNDEPENLSIERPNISVEAAFEKFRLQRLNGDNIDFRQNRGYSTGESQSNARETVTEKLIRLKREVRELAEEFKANPPSANNSTEIQDLHQLEKELGNLVKFRNPDGLVLQKKLESMGDNEKDGGGSSNNPIQYELLVERKLGKAGSGVAGTSQTAMELESRIHRLEQVLGTGKDSLMNLGFQKKNSSVMGALTVLSSKLSLLEPSHIEIIEAKLTAVLQKVNSIIEKKVDVQELERTLKLSSLYDLLEASASTIEVLPELAQRLEAVKNLHYQASNAVTEIHSIKTAQDGVAAGMLENDKLLKELKSVITQSISGN